MVDRPANLPDYQNPPVVEVALSVRFEPLDRLQTVHIGLLWQAFFREKFSVVEEHPPLPLVLEAFSGTSQPSLQVEFGPPPLPRQWFLNQDGSQLIQIQSDGFVHNWRQATPDLAYPRYEQVKDQFIVYFAAFRNFLAMESLGDAIPIQCEVTYVNHIEAGSGWEKPNDFSNVFTTWSGQYSDSFLSDPEQIRLNVSYVIPGDEGEPLGRLHIACQPSIRVKDKKRVLVFRLVARGMPDGDGIEGATRFLDRGREWIVRGFTSFTTGEMHKIWKRRGLNAS